MARQIGKRLRELRANKGWQQVDLAAHVGVAQGTISLIESGRRLPSLTTLVVAAAELGVPIIALFAADGDP